MTPEQQMTSGGTFLHIMNYIIFKFGTNGMNTFNKKNTLNFNNIFQEQLYPLEDYIKVLSDLQDIFNDDNIAYKIGWHRGKTMMLGKGLGRTPEETLEKVVSAWDKFNNFGAVSTKRIGENKISIILSDFQSDPIYCQRMCGFFGGIISGGDADKCRVSETQCMCSGGASCEFLIELKKWFFLLNGEGFKVKLRFYLSKPQNFEPCTLK